jgi:arsenate reductase
MAEAPELIQRPTVLLDEGSGVLERTAEALNEAARRAPGNGPRGGVAAVDSLRTKYGVAK